MIICNFADTLQQATDYCGRKRNVLPVQYFKRRHRAQSKKFAEKNEEIHRKQDEIKQAYRKISALKSKLGVIQIFADETARQQAAEIAVSSIQLIQTTVTFAVYVTSTNISFYGFFAASTNGKPFSGRMCTISSY